MASVQSTCLAVKCDAPPPIAPTAKPIRIAGLSPGIGSPKWVEARERHSRRMRKRRPHIKAGQELFRDRENEELACHQKVSLGQKKKDPGTGDTRKYRFFYVDCGSCGNCQAQRLRKWREKDLEVIATWDRVEQQQCRTDKEREKLKKRIGRAGGVSFRLARLRGGTQILTNAHVGGVPVTDVAAYLESFYAMHVDATAHNPSTSYHRSAKLSPETIEEKHIAPLGTNVPEDTDTEAVTDIETDTDRDDPAVIVAAYLDVLEAKVDADPLSSGKTHTELLELKHMALTPDGFPVASMNPDNWSDYVPSGELETPTGTPSDPLPETEPKATKRVSAWEQPKPVRKGFISIALKYGGTSRELRGVSGAYLVEVPQDKADEFEDVAFLDDKEVAPKPCTCFGEGDCLRHPKRKTSGEGYGVKS